jgi:hypothetical protein
MFIEENAKTTLVLGIGVQTTQQECLILSLDGTFKITGFKNRLHKSTKILININHKSAFLKNKHRVINKSSQIFHNTKNKIFYETNHKTRYNSVWIRKFLFFTQHRAVRILTES